MKAERFEQTPRHVGLLSREEARGQIWTRGAQWELRGIEGLDARIVLDDLRVTLSFDALYEGVIHSPDEPAPH